MLKRMWAVVAATALVVAAAPLQAQTQTVEPLEVGAVAPDFSMPGGTRYGVLRDEVRLSDFAGKTVVLSFFFRARSRG
ncbi:MAG: hypothetical protein PVJ64_11605 [Gemmatimonadales bacterium]|jgi:hypothetical protein